MSCVCSAFTARYKFPLLQHNFGVDRIATHRSYTIMLFCSDHQREVSRQLQLQGNHEIQTCSSDGPTEERAPQRSSQPELPRYDTPISIFDFAELSRGEQKRWLEASCGKNNGDSKTGDMALYCSSVSSGSSEKTEETDSISSVSSRSSDLCTDGIQRRSIFAPYWAKIGQEERSATLSVQDNMPRSPDSKMEHRVPAAPRRSVIGCQISLTAATRVQRVVPPALPPLEVVIATLLPERPSFLLPHRRASSTSAMSILKKKESQQGRHKRSNSFSVTFDSKVNVVLVFDDTPTFRTTRTSPWWVRWLAAAGTTEGDVACNEVRNWTCRSSLFDLDAKILGSADRQTFITKDEHSLLNLSIAFISKFGVQALQISMSMTFIFLSPVSNTFL